MRNRIQRGLPVAVMLLMLAGCASESPLTRQESRITQLADELARRGDTTSAVTLYERAAAAMPDDPDILLALGNAHLQNGDPSAATQAFQQAYRLRDGDAQAVLGLGYAALLEGRLKRAHELIAQAAPRINTSSAYNLLGVICTLTGAFEEAVPAFQAAQAQEPSSLELKTNLALAYALSNDRDNAIGQMAAVTASPLAEPHHTRRAVLILTLVGDDKQANELALELPSQERATLLSQAKRISELPDATQRAAAIGIVPRFAPTTNKLL